MKIPAFLGGLCLLAMLTLGFALPATAAPSETCFTRALNGDVIDPPMCFVAEAHKGSADNNPACGPGFEPVFEDGRLTACVEVVAPEASLILDLGLGGAMTAMLGLLPMFSTRRRESFSVPNEGGGVGGPDGDNDVDETEAGHDSNENAGDESDGAEDGDFGDEAEVETVQS